MKYGIWRHENALGNSAEQAVNLGNFIQEKNDKNPIIYVEKDFQKDFALCIPNVREENVMFFDKSFDIDKLNITAQNHEFFKDIYMPDVYFYHLPKHYPSVWSDLKKIKYFLKFPEEIYENNHNLPKKAIVLSIREKGTYDKRVDGANCDPCRFVNIQRFFELALNYANKGYSVVRIGDKNQTPMPKHENILDFALVENRRMLDDLYLINNCKVFLSCDSGIWPMAGGLKKNLVLSNVVSVFSGNVPPKYDIVNWLPKETSTVLYKRDQISIDNTLEELTEAINKFL